jgi:NADPH:quinone reductase-like Zn-dependent oxidoreductase
MRDRYGPPEVVEIREVAKPVPVDDQVLVQVRAASVNRADLDNMYPRWQFLRLFLGLRVPRQRSLGIDVAGVVESVGQKVTWAKPGDRVFADLYEFGQGAFAEYACAPERAFAPMPAGVSFEQAATLPHSAVLALQGLRLRRGRTFKPGAEVLIVGASGNVGPFAIQIAKSRGAAVTGVARTEKLDFVRSLGADEVIDYRSVDYTATGRRFDWIVDVDAHHSVWKWRHSLKPGGAYVAMGGSAGWFGKTLIHGPLLTLLTRRSMGLMLSWKPFNSADVDELKRLMAAGELKPHIDRVFPLSEVVAALRWVDDGHAKGKVVITPMASSEPTT